MADRTDLAINLEAALELRGIVFAERAGERPLQLRGRHLLHRLRGSRGRKDAGKHGGAERKPGFHDSPPAHALAPRTDSEIEFGNGLVFSKMPSSGRMIRKKAK